MSQSIRMLLGPSRARLTNNLADAVSLVTRQPSLALERVDNLAARRWVSEAKGKIIRLQSDMKLLEDQFDEWHKLLAGLKGAALEAEKALYKEWSEGTIDPPAAEGIPVIADRARTTIIDLEARIAEINEAVSWANVQAPAAAAPAPAQAAVTAISESVNRIRLAPYELPPFSGDRDDWWEFHQAFEAMVDHDIRLRPFEKLGMLKRAVVDGKANKLIGSLAITDDNYAVAKKLLEDEFGNKQELIRALNSRLLGLKPCHSTTQVREFHTELESICQQLENLGSNITDGEHVIELISSKLTKPANRELITAQANFMSTPQFDPEGRPVMPVWTAKRVRHELGKIVRREGLVERTYHNEHKPSVDSPGPKGVGRVLRSSARRDMPRPHPSTAMAVRGSTVEDSTSETDEWDEVESSEDEELTAAVQAKPYQRRGQSSRQRPMKCLLCEKDHWMSYCPRYPDVGSRVNRLREMERCTRCFSKDHTRGACTKQFQCRRCDSSGHKKPLCNKPPRDASRDRQTTKDSRPRNGAKVAPVNAPDSTSSEDEWYEQPESDHSVASGVKLATTKLPSGRKETTLLMCKRVMAYNPENKAAKREAVIFFDSGSTKSFISESFAKEIGLSLVQRNELELERFNDNPVRMTTWKTRVGITTPKGKTLNLAIVTTPSIVRKAPAIQIDEDQAKQLKNGKKVALNLAQADPDIMIGSDYFEQPFQVRWQMRTPGGFSVYKSKVGHLVFGRGTPDAIGTKAQVVVAPAVGRAKRRPTPDEAENEEEEERLVRQFLSLEGAGINDDPRRDADREAVELVRQGMRRNAEGRYEVPLPWRLPKELPPNNKGLALGRMRSGWRARKDKPERLMSYDRAIRKYAEKQAAELLSDPDKADGHISYIPHHGVPKKDGEERIVFAANAKSYTWEYSLNQCLLQGPAIGMKNLVGILLRSRLHEVVVIADIEGAFTQISVRVEDRDVMRFLWMKDPTKGPVNGNIIVYRFCRVMFGVICSPFQLGIVLTDHSARYPSIAARKIEEELYVDNLHLFGEDAEEVKGWVEEAKTIMKDAHMHLREFASNKDETLADTPNEDRLPEQRQKLLGITWDTKADEYIFKSHIGGRDDNPNLVSNKKITKRQVLRDIARHYDPLGLIAPVLVKARLFFQHLCLTGIEWKEELKDEQVQEWAAITADWQGPEVHVPRQATKRQGKHELHIFADASGTTYAIAAYLRTTVGQETEAKCHLIFSKSRVKPIQFCRRERDHDFTPRLELLAVVMATRVLANLREELRIELESPSYIWTDSTCTLGWLNSLERQEVFVENRLRTIRSASDLVVQHVRSEDNPADLATRGLSMSELSNNQLWWGGPDWLRESPESWPTEIHTYDSRRSKEVEVNEMSGMDQRLDKIWKALPAIFEANQQKAAVGPESWNEKVLERCRQRDAETIQPTAEDRQEAIKEIIQDLQKEGSLPDSPNLNTFTDADGIIRVNCGLQNAPIPGAQRTPILLPRNSIVTRMIILDLHTRLNHAGVAITLRNLRETYWVPTGRRTVSNVIRRCEDCQPFLAQHYEQPRPPALPRDRVRDEAPFRTTGLDYFGPTKLLVDKDKHQRKHWTALFTCLATRSVHLELVDDLTAYSFLLALRRFIAIRGVPAVLLSDNATTFKLGAKVVDEMCRMADLFQDEAVMAYSARVGIAWKWITERAPWRGGAYEKMVDLVKRALRVVIGRQLLPREVFDTLLKEAAAIVNSRPISFLYESPTEPLPLRPMDFLQPWGGGQAIAGPAEEGPIGEPEDTRQDAMIALWTRINHRLDLFWDAWRGDYLAWLRERATVVRKGGRRGEPKIGTIVMLGDDPDSPRGTWPIGKISELVPSSDGVVRTVKIALPNKREVKRAVNMVYPLEAEPDETDGPNEPPAETAAEVPKAPQTKDNQPERTKSPVRQHYGLRSRKIPKITATATMTAIIVCCLLPTLTWADPRRGSDTSASFHHHHPTRPATAYGDWLYWTRGQWKNQTQQRGLIGWSSGMGCLLDSQNEAQVRAKFKLWTAFDRPPLAKGELNQSTIYELYQWASGRWHDKLVHHGFHQRSDRRTVATTSTTTPRPQAMAHEQPPETPKYDTATAILRGGLQYMGILKRRRRIVGAILGIANLAIEGYLFHRINQLQDQLNKLSLGGEFMEKLAEGLEREAEQRRLAMAKALMEVAMEDTLRTLTEMLQTGRIPPELLSSEGREKLIKTALNGTTITRWTYLRFPTALSQFSRVDIENRGRAWFSQDQPSIDTLITIPMLETEQGNPRCGIFVRHMKHIGVPNSPHSLMRLEVPEQTVVFPDRILGFPGKACKHRTAEIDVCDSTRVETEWPFHGHCLSDDPRVLPWMSHHPSERCQWEMVAQGHKECLSLTPMENPTGDWRIHTNCRELKIQEEGRPCRRVPLTGNWTVMRLVLKNNQTAELGDLKLRNLPNAPMEHAERIYLLQQSITRQLAPPVTNSTEPTLRQKIHEWHKNVTKPNVDPEKEVEGVIDSAKESIYSVGRWIVERYQWIIAMTVLCICAPIILWLCCQVGWWCVPKCFKCCLRCWRPRRPARKRRKGHKGDHSERAEKEKEDHELLEVNPSEDRVSIDAAKRRVHFVVAREGRPETTASATDSTPTTPTKLPSWATPWKSVTTITILGLCLTITGATGTTHQAITRSEWGGDYNPCLIGLASPGPEWGGDYNPCLIGCFAIGPLNTQIGVGDYNPYLDYSQPTMSTVDDALLDYDEEVYDAETTTPDAPVPPRPELAPALGGAFEPRRRFSPEACRVRTYCRLLGSKIAQRFDSEPALAETYRRTVAIDTESIMLKATTTRGCVHGLAVVSVVALPNFDVRYEAVVRRRQDEVGGPPNARGPWADGYMTNKTGLVKGDLQGAHTKEMSVVVAETQAMLKDTDCVVLAGSNELKALQLQHPTSSATPKLDVASFIELQHDQQVKDWADNQRQPGLQAAFLGAFGFDMNGRAHDCRADAMMTLALYCKARGIITQEIVAESNERHRRMQPARVPAPRRLADRPPPRLDPPATKRRRVETTEQPATARPPPPPAPDRARKPAQQQARQPSPKAPTHRDPSPPHHVVTKEDGGGWGIIEPCRHGAPGHQGCRHYVVENHLLSTPMAMILYFWGKRNQHGKQTKERDRQWKAFVEELQQATPESLLDNWKTRWSRLFGAPTKNADGTDAHRAKLPSRDCIKQALRERRLACLRASTHLRNAIMTRVTKPYHWDDTSPRSGDSGFTQVASDWTLALNQALAMDTAKQLMSTTYVVIGDNWAVRLYGEMEPGRKSSVLGTNAEIIDNLQGMIFTDVQAFLIFSGLESIRQTEGHEATKEHFASLGRIVDMLPRYAPTYYVEPPRVDDRVANWTEHHQAAVKFVHAAPSHLKKIGLAGINRPEVGRIARSRLIERDGQPTHLGLQLILDQLNDHGHHARLTSEPTEFKVKGRLCLFGQPENEEVARGPLDERIRQLLLQPNKAGPSTGNSSNSDDMDTDKTGPSASKQ